MSEERADSFELLFQLNPSPTWIFDRETLALLEVNRAMCERYEYTREELLKLTLRDLWPPDTRDWREETTKHDVTQPLKSARVSRHITKSGRELDVNVSLTRLDFRGRPAAMAVVSDASGVAEAERRFELLVAHSADGISTADEHGTITYLSPSVERILGFAPGELVGKHALARTHPDDKLGFPKIAPGESRRFVSRSQHRDGSWRYIEAVATNLLEDPRVRAFVSNFRDVTERQREQEQIRRSEKNFRELIESSPTATVLHRGPIVWVNRAVLRMLGYESTDELIGRPILDLVHVDDRAMITERIGRARAEGSTLPQESRMLRRDGSSVVIEAHGALLEFDGEPTYLVLAHDVTQRRELFTRMAVADRMLSIGTLAAGVAHEINNPLAYLMTNLALIELELPKLLTGEVARVDQSELAEMLADAKEGAERVGAIVRELSTLARPEHDIPSPVDVIAVLTTSIKMVHNEIRHRAKIVESYGPDLPRARANASRLGQVFLNLLTNAAHAIADGSASANEIRVRARAEDAWIVVEIEDTGAGMPADVLDRVFDPFFTTKPPGIGVGLGLSICHQIVSSIGGKITATSRVGAGSTFRVALPIVQGVEPAVHAVELAANGARARILMIDDEAAVGRSIKLVLSPEHDVEVVTRAKEALGRLCGGEAFDLVLCDLMMPEMSGIEFYEQLTDAAPSYVDRVVFMTGGAFTPQARAFIDQLTVPPLEKPFTEQALLQVIARVAGKYRS